MKKSCNAVRRDGSIQECYNLLAVTIVEQAVKDYEKHCNALRRNPEDSVAIMKIDTIKKFFKSEWFSFLVHIDGDKLIMGLEEMLKFERKSNRRNKRK